MELITIRMLGGGCRNSIHMRVCEERSGADGSGVNGNVKDTGSEKLKCHQPAVQVAGQLLRSTRGAFLETSLPLHTIQAQKEQTCKQCYAVGVGHKPQ